MRLGKGLAASAVAMAIAVGSDSEWRSAQSFTIPTECVEGAECAALCRSAVEQGRTESDFIALASYQLGPERPIDMPPANLSRDLGSSLSPGSRITTRVKHRDDIDASICFAEDHEIGKAAKKRSSRLIG